MQNQPLSPDTSAKTPFFEPPQPPPFAVLSLATRRSWKDRNSGARPSVAEWHRCVVFGNSRTTRHAHQGHARSSRRRDPHPPVHSSRRRRQRERLRRSITEIRVFRIMNLNRPARPGRSAGAA